MSQALICGSFAFDTIMVFNDKFKHHILPDQVHMLNVSFMVPDMRREFGGCAGNIAYSLKLLGGNALPMGTIGVDFDPYSKWMQECDIPQTHLTTVEHTYTGQAFITTDMDDNQITAFHPGAMSFSHYNKVNDAKNVSIGIISPDGRDGMIQHAEQFAQAGIPFVFDPGQGIPMFGKEDFLKFYEQATWVVANDYEWQMMHERTNLTAEQVAQQVKATIVTKGAEGATVYTADNTYEIPCAKAHHINDPTGCGDAFRSGLLYGLMNNLDWETTGKIASLMGAINVEYHGTQNHKITQAEFKQRFQESFGIELTL